MFLSLRGSRSRLIITLAWTSFAVASIACTSSSGAKAGFVSIGDVALTDYTAVVCERFQRCYPDLVKSFFGNADACIARVGTASEKEFTGLGTTVSQNQLNACTDKLRQARCEVEGNDLTVEAHAFLTECEFKGTLGLGASCSSSAQCQTGSCFKSPATSGIADCGTCSERVAAGADCTAANCTNGLVCFNNKCTVPSDADGACNTETPCAGILRCVAGKCQKPLGKDAECNPTATTVLCDPSLGLRCLPTTPIAPTKGKCADVVFSKLGEKCGFDKTAVKLTLCLGSSCTSDDNGVCVADLAEGAPCSDAESVECEFPLSCIGGSCARADPSTCK
jgi:hypothetical protein